MTPTIKIAPVHKTIVVAATPAQAFEVFTAGLNRWWPKSHGLGTTPVRESRIEPFVGGRWHSTFEDGSEAVVGHVLVWQPPERFVCTWEISAKWRPDPRPAFTSEIEVRFSHDGSGGTRVELEHRNFERMGPLDGESMRNGVDRGWPGLLELFAAAAAAPAPGAPSTRGAPTA